jgi:hypothetical protein
MKSRLQVFKIDLDIISQNFVVLIGDREKANICLRKMFGGDEDMVVDENCRGMFFELEGKKPAIWLRERPKTAQQIASVAHEAFHATCYFMKLVGIEYCGKSEEAFAYTLDHIIESILNKVK